MKEVTVICKEDIHKESVQFIDSMGDAERTQPRLRYFHNIISNLKLSQSMKAVQVIEEEMSKEKGFSRHNGESYFVHPIAVAQTAIDFGLVDDMIRAGDHHKADVLIASSLIGKDTPTSIVIRTIA